MEIIAGILIILAGIVMLLTCLAMWRAPDALTRANLLSTATGISLPFVVFASLLVDFSRGDLSVGTVLRALLACVAFLVVLAVGSFLMGRSLYGLAKEQQGISNDDTTTVEPSDHEDDIAAKGLTSR